MICVSECGSDQKYIQSSGGMYHCIDSCPDSDSVTYYLYGSQCVTKCPVDYPYVEHDDFASKQCTATCKMGTYAIDPTKGLQTLFCQNVGCTKYYFNDNGMKKCYDTCPSIAPYL